MIKNERQYKITRSRADEVRNTIGELHRAALPEGLQPEMRALQLYALRGTLGDLEGELAEYDALHDAAMIEATGIEQLPTSLIRARIARGLTQRQLAERIGLQEQAIQRYEAADYSGASFARLVEVAEALDLTIHYDIRLHRQAERADAMKPATHNTVAAGRVRHDFQRAGSNAIEEGKADGHSR